MKKVMSKKWIYALVLVILSFAGCFNEEATKEKVATPVVSPSAGTYTESQNVVLTTKTDGASIYYTTNGTLPGKYSKKYVTPITVSENMTIRAIAKKDGMEDSDILIAKYIINAQTITEKVATPTFTPAAGTYTTTQAITISVATTGASIYYTLDGTTPSAISTKYTAPFNISTTKTVKAIAVKDGMDNSDVVIAVYTITASNPTNKSPLLFSEYVEGNGGNNKALEIYNSSTENVVLRSGDTHNYFMIKLDGKTEEKSWAKGEVFQFEDGNSIKPGEVFVV